eukprot:2698789-Pyramimonas_sp.AAC.1
MAARPSLGMHSWERAVSPVLPPANVMREIMTALDMHLLSTVAAGIALTPKHHLLAHMLQRSEGGDGMGRQSLRMDGFATKFSTKPPLGPW